MEAKEPVTEQPQPVLPLVPVAESQQLPAQIQPSSHPDEKSDPAAITALNVQTKSPQEEQKARKQTVAEAEQFLDQDHSDMNMVVAIRVRPTSSKEIANGEFEILSIEDKLLIVHDPKELECEEVKHLDVLHRSKEQKFFFDRIFRNTSQEMVYQRSCRNLVKPILEGYNATVFAYGTTGSGKTYTMVGTQEEPGIMVLTLRDIFAAMAQDTEREYELKVSYVEIYNEVIHDLLVHNSRDTFLELRDDPIKGVTIAGVTETKVEDSKHVMGLLLQGNRRRTTESTNANQTSSRSHAVFQIMVSSKSRTKATDVEVLCGKLSLIDLAGSERGSVTENRGIRLMEGAKINRSLLSLANCINALGDKSKKGVFVPYRDSKLTRMLKDSLGGNCRTVMIATISPANMQYEETVNTLKYASRAKNIKIKAIPNKKLVLMHISAYKHIISDLRDEIERLKAKIKTDPVRQPEGGVSKCTCGRGEDEEAKKQMYKEVAQAYDDIMQLEQALIELDEQNTMNSIEIKKREAKILIFFNSMIEKQGKNVEVEDVNSINLDALMTDDEETKAVKEQIKRQQEKIAILKENTKRNIEKRQLMKRELLESYELIRKIRQDIPNRLKHQDARDYLELVIKNNFLEAQNVQLLLNLQLQARTISQLKSMIMRQQRYIQENHLDNNENMRKIFAGKQFDEVEEDEDYKSLLVATPSGKDEAKKEGEAEAETEEAVLMPEAAAGSVEELVGIIVGEQSAEDPMPSEELTMKKVSEGGAEQTGELPFEILGTKAAGVAEEEKAAGSETSGNNTISVTGVSAFKIEGKSVGPAAAPSAEKKPPAASTKKSAKENKGKGSAAAQPANLSIMGSKIAASKKSGAPPTKGKGK